MKKSFFCAGIFVLCQIFIFVFRLNAQTSDSTKADSSASIVFKQKNNASSPLPEKSQFWAIPSLSVGPYSGFHDHGIYGTVFQPNLGIDFLAEPAGWLHFLLGARLGFSNAVTTGISLGLREPISVKKPDLNFFTDFNFLFFDDAEFVGPLKYGARLAFGARTSGNINMEYRLAGEWRGAASDFMDGNRSRQLWWIGAEVGVAFSLYHDRRERSRNELLHASLQYIATAEELDELDDITSDAKLDKWLDRFWIERDVIRHFKNNPFRAEYEKRVENANHIFSHGNTLGIVTEPGRVLAIYGTPDVQMKDRSEYNARMQYMLFVYQGRLRDVTFAVFLFQKPDTEIEWKQIYSNVPGELTGNLPNDIPRQMQQWTGL
jgi:GWxTD domain-containing protein